MSTTQWSQSSILQKGWVNKTWDENEHGENKKSSPIVP
jgi:hypothetical protein